MSLVSYVQRRRRNCLSAVVFNINRLSQELHPHDLEALLCSHYLDDNFFADKI